MTRSTTGAWGIAIGIGLDQWDLLDPVALDLVQELFPSPVRVGCASASRMQAGKMRPRVYELAKRRRGPGYYWTSSEALSEQFCPRGRFGWRSGGDIWAHRAARETAERIAEHIGDALRAHGLTPIPLALYAPSCKQNRALEPEAAAILGGSCDDARRDRILDWFWNRELDLDKLGGWWRRQITLSTIERERQARRLGIPDPFADLATEA